MGKAVAEIARERGHEVVYTLDKDDALIDLDIAEVVVEFSTPEAAFDNISSCLLVGVPVVSGTTGWLDRRQEVEELCRSRNGAFLYASNFSIGVNIFFAINRYLAKLMQGRGYKVKIKEIHHIHKLDAPSGTAVTLAEQILPYSKYDSWIPADNTDIQGLPIQSVREGEENGYHEVTYSSDIDILQISHNAFSRKGFALGAVLAAEYILGS